MLLEFTVGNFLSFKDRKTISLQASSIKDFEEENVALVGNNKLLKGAIVYGANASGKSNLMSAVQAMTRLVLNSSENSSAKELDVTPFLLNTITEEQPSFFEMLFLLDDIRYRYGFEVDRQAVRTEWLFETKVRTEKPLFIREGEGIEVFPAFKEGKDLEEKTRDNALFLSVVDQFNGRLSGRIVKWFSNCKVHNGLSHEEFKHLTVKLLKRQEFQSILMPFYSTVGLGFDNIETTERPWTFLENSDILSEKIISKLRDSVSKSSQTLIHTTHKKYNEQGDIDGEVSFDMKKQESAGTNKLFNVSGPIFRILQEGGVLAIDELDTSLHPLLTLAITQLFNSCESNPHNAQLIFATHDTNLLSYGNFRRDQIYFTEKDRLGSTDLYSLVEYKLEDNKKVRIDNSFEKDYIQGRYGAIPYIGNIGLLTRKLVINSEPEIEEKWQEK